MISADQCSHLTVLDLQQKDTRFPRPLCFVVAAAGDAAAAAIAAAAFVYLLVSWECRLEGDWNCEQLRGQWEQVNTRRGQFVC